MDLNSSPESAKRQIGAFWWVLLLFVALLSLFFFKSFLPGWVHFSNDGPLGSLSAQYVQLPEAFRSVWGDLNSIGFYAGNAGITLSCGLRWMLGAVGYSKFFAPLAILILGLGAWCFFRWLGFSAPACVLGGLAAMLNSTFFSVACWGIGAHAIAMGMIFFALALLTDTHGRARWVRVALAGLAVGMAVAEGADVGALLSLLLAAFVVFQAFLPRFGVPTLASEASAGTPSCARTLVRGAVIVAVVAAFAAWMAFQTITSLVATNIKGVVGMAQDTQTRTERWDWATQWSLPKREVLGLIVPGLFGYRMDASGGGNYWGAMGRDAAWDRYFEGGEQGPPPQKMLRYSGGGNYVGILVMAVALWTVFQSLRKENSVFSVCEKRFIWFWTFAAVVSLLLALGRFAPFYQLFYALPYASTIRNPTKFLYPLDCSLVVLFAIGVHALSRRARPGLVVPPSGGLGEAQSEAPENPDALPLKGGTTNCAGDLRLISYLKVWWAKAGSFDRKWVKGAAIVLEASLLAWVVYALLGKSLVAYLQKVDFDGAEAPAVASFSLRQGGWFLLFLAVGLGLFTLVLSGFFSGRRARLGAFLLGGFLVLDLGRADSHWIVYWNYPEKYASNPVVDLLRDRPYEHRVAIWPLQGPPAFLLLDQLYHIEWLPQLFPYYDIQSLDLVQMGRKPADFAAFEKALQFDYTSNTVPRISRRWQLTNTRYLLGTASLLDALNKEIDPIQQRFRVVTNFDIVPKPGVAKATRAGDLTVVTRPRAQYALFEFTGALARASLYADWQQSDDTNSLALLGSASFDPGKTVLVADTPAGVGPASTNQRAGAVEFLDYEPKTFHLRTMVSAPSVLLLNDHFDPHWKVFVDGEPHPVLRCNYIMRGVYLLPGTHRVEFRFEHPAGAIYLSLAAISLGLVLSLVLLVWRE